MERPLFIFLALIILIFASCEDKKKSGETTVNPTSDTLKILNDSLAKKIEEEFEERAEDLVKKREEPLLTQEELIPFLTKYGQENPETLVLIKTDFGDIKVRLFKDTPLHRANFIFLAKHNYFNDTYFHRVAKGFVIQGGNSDNPNTATKRNNVGSFLIPGEFDKGHVHNRGAFSAAKYSEQNVSKASSPFEFFIVQSKRGAHHLDNEHTVYGEVISGMDVVDKINEQPVGEGEWPITNVHLDVEILE